MGAVAIVVIKKVYCVAKLAIKIIEKGYINYFAYFISLKQWRILLKLIIYYF